MALQKSDCGRARNESLWKRDSDDGEAHAMLLSPDAAALGVLFTIRFVCTFCACSEDQNTNMANEMVG